MHRDLQDNFLLQVFGRKRVTLVAPHHADVLNARMVTPFLHTTDVRQGMEPPPETDPVSVVLGAGDMLYLPAGYFHATHTECEPEDEQEHPCESSCSGEEGDEGKGFSKRGIGCSVNYFMSACFASLGVIVPDFAGLAPDWLDEPPREMESLASAID